MSQAAWLPWTERDTLAGKLDELAGHFPSPGEFALWRAGALGAFIGGGMAFVGTPRAGWLLQGGEGYWAVVATMGEPDASELVAIFEAVQAEARLVVWDDDVGEGWAEALADRGARALSRRTYVQDLSHVRHKALDEDDVAVVSWAQGDWREEAIALLARANADSLEGMFLTLPLPPTLANCQSAFERAAAGHHGELLGWASFVAVADGSVVGALMCVQGEHGAQGTLFDLYVDVAWRGRQLSRRLVAAMQSALVSAGYRENRFLTMGTNAPVHRLFHPDEIVAEEATLGGYWIKGGPA